MVFDSVMKLDTVAAGEMCDWSNIVSYRRLKHFVSLLISVISHCKVLKRFFDNARLA